MVGQHDPLRTGFAGCGDVLLRPFHLLFADGTAAWVVLGFLVVVGVQHNEVNAGVVVGVVGTPIDCVVADWRVGVLVEGGEVLAVLPEQVVLVVVAWGRRGGG